MPSVCGGADNDTVGQDCNPGPGWLEALLSFAGDAARPNVERTLLEWFGTT
jgi:hypothetical protein